MITELTKSNFEQEIMLEQKPILIDFWASWCGPCKMVSPIIDEISEEYDGEIKVCKVNVDEEGILASEFAIVSIPTILLVKDGKIVERLVGVRSKDDFCDEIDKLL